MTYTHLIITAMLLATPFLGFTQQPNKPKTQGTTMEAINHTKVDTTTSATVRAMIQILRNKHKYIGQPFSVLIKDLPDSIRYFYPNPATPKDYIACSSYTFGFINFHEEFANVNKPQYSLYKIAILIIEWKQPIIMDEIRPLLKDYNNWNKEAEDFLSSHIVSNIEIGEPVEVAKAGGWLNWP